METTYKKIVEINDLFKKIAETPMPGRAAQVFLKGLLELEKKYSEIDNAITEINQHHPDNAQTLLDEFLKTETTLENFPIWLPDMNIITMSPIELLRLQDFIKPLED